MIPKTCETCDNYRHIQHFLTILDRRVKHIKPLPGETPALKDIDIYGETISKGGTVGGDHIIYIDFNKRYDLEARIREVEEGWQQDVAGLSKEEIETNLCVQRKKQEKDRIIEQLRLNRTRAGVLVADVKGHDESAAFIVGMLHQSFLTGTLYELSLYGNITTHLFEIINTRFYNSSSIDDFLTMLYGEISVDGTFKFITAGHPKPMVFSNEFNRLVDIHPELIANYPPIGIMPSAEDIDAAIASSNLGYKQSYTVNKIKLMGKGDILLLYTDGLSDHAKADGDMFFPGHLEEALKNHKHLPSRDICFSLKEALLEFNPELEDDITYLVIKKN
jgi:serine phosphatase RsbU (regulator of sigma subunit)